MRAAEGGHVHVVDLFLKHGANVDLQDNVSYAQQVICRVAMVMYCCCSTGWCSLLPRPIIYTYIERMYGTS